MFKQQDLQLQLQLEDKLFFQLQPKLFQDNLNSNSLWQDNLNSNNNSLCSILNNKPTCREFHNMQLQQVLCNSRFQDNNSSKLLLLNSSKQLFHNKHHSQFKTIFN